MLSGDNGAGPKIIYQYKNGKLQKNIDFRSMGDWVDVKKVTKQKITMEIKRCGSAIGYFSYKCNLVYKNGKLVPDAKTYKIYFYSPANGKHSYLTAKKDIQLYQFHNTKKKSFVLKKGQKVKAIKYYLNGKTKMFQVKTKSGKIGWFVDPNGKDYVELFEGAFGVA